MRRIAIQANELFGTDNEVGEPSGGLRGLRLILTLQDGAIMSLETDEESDIVNVPERDSQPDPNA